MAAYEEVYQCKKISFFGSHLLLRFQNAQPMPREQLRLHFQHAYQHKYLLGTAKFRIEGVHKHACVSNVDWEFSDLFSLFSEIEPLIDQLVGKQYIDGFRQLLFLGFLQHIEGNNIFYSQTFQLQDEIAEIHSKNLRRQAFRHSVKSIFSVGSKTLSVSYSPCSARPLVCAAFAAGDNDHLINPCLPVKYLDLNVPRIDDELDIWNGDWALCYVGGEDDLPVIASLEDEVLVLSRHLGMQGKNFKPSLILDHVGVEHVCQPLNFLYGSQKYQYFAGMLLSVDVDNRLEDL